MIQYLKLICSVWQPAARGHRVYTDLSAARVRGPVLCIVAVPHATYADLSVPWLQIKLCAAVQVQLLMYDCACKRKSSFNNIDIYLSISVHAHA